MFTVKNLSKSYDGFKLDGISFTVPRGYIVGFIGANGAGKSTTLKSMLNIIKPDSGEVSLDGLNMAESEGEIKKKVALSLGQFDYYPYESADKIAKYYKAFFPEWSDEKYNYYMKKFALSGKKKIRDYSAGMKVKFSLTLALSHDAQLFVFDEPTSGLDPVARDEVLQIFREIVEDGDKSIIYSTHITSDLDKCADYILFIDGGKLLLDDAVESVISSHALVTVGAEFADTVLPVAIGYKQNKYALTALIKSEDAERLGLEREAPNLEDIMVYYGRGRRLKENEN